MALISVGALIGLFLPELSQFNTSSIPQFWLALVGGAGLLIAPAYFFRCYYMLIYEPDSYTEHREGKLRDYFPKKYMDAPDMSED